MTSITLRTVLVAGAAVAALSVAACQKPADNGAAASDANAAASDANAAASDANAAASTANGAAADANAAAN